MGSIPKSAPCTRHRHCCRQSYHWRLVHYTDARHLHWIPNISRVSQLLDFFYGDLVCWYRPQNTSKFDIFKQLTSHPYFQHRKTNSPICDTASWTTSRKRFSSRPATFRCKSSTIAQCPALHCVLVRLGTLHPSSSAQFDSTFSSVLWTFLSLSVTVKENICK